MMVETPYWLCLSQHNNRYGTAVAAPFVYAPPPTARRIHACRVAGARRGPSAVLDKDRARTPRGSSCRRVRELGADWAGQKQPAQSARDMSTSPTGPGARAQHTKRPPPCPLGPWRRLPGTRSLARHHPVATYFTVSVSAQIVDRFIWH